MLQPLALGGLIDKSASFWRTHFRALFPLCLAYQLTSYISTKLAVGPAQKLLTATHLDPAGAEFISAVARALGGVVGVMTLLGWLTWIVAVAGSHYAVAELTGRLASVGAAVRHSFSRLGTTSLAYGISLAWGGAVTLAVLSPGALLITYAVRHPTGALAQIIAGVVGLVWVAVGPLGVGLWYVLRFLLTPQVIAEESVGAWRSLQRSGSLISGRVGDGPLGWVKVRATVVLTAVFAILMIVGLIASLPALIVTFAHGNPLAGAVAATQSVGLIAAELFETVVVAAFTPLWLGFGAVFYLDMRVRREGLDLQLELARTEKADA